MPHQRKLIRDRVRDLLRGKTVAGDRVYATRVLPLRTREVAALAVYTTDERIDPGSATTAPRELTRELALVIEGIVVPSSSVTVDDAIDALILQVETVLHADPTLGDVAADSILDGTETEVLDDGDRLTGWFALSYSVTYRADEPAAPVNLDDFMTAHVRHDLGGVVAAEDETRDVVVVQEVSP